MVFKFKTKNTNWQLFESVGPMHNNPAKLSHSPGKSKQFSPLVRLFS